MEPSQLAHPNKPKALSTRRRPCQPSQSEGEVAETSQRNSPRSLRDQKRDRFPFRPPRPSTPSSPPWRKGIIAKKNLVADNFEATDRVRSTSVHSHYPTLSVIIRGETEKKCETSPFRLSKLCWIAAFACQVPCASIVDRLTSNLVRKQSVSVRLNSIGKWKLNMG